MLRRTFFSLAVLGLLSTATTPAPAASGLDSPSIVVEKPLDPAAGAASVAGETGAGKLGFPGHLYRPSVDGVARVVMEVRNQDANANGGIAYRPYMRIQSRNDNAEARSSNGHRFGEMARAELVFRVKKGETYVVVSSLALHILGAERAKTHYTLTVTEVAR